MLLFAYRYEAVSQLAYGAARATKAAAARVFPPFLLLKMFSFGAIGPLGFLLHLD